MKSKLLFFAVVLMGCSVVSSLNTARVEQITVNQVKVTTLAAGLLTIASTQRITAIRGTDVSPCTLENTYRGTNHGVICKGIKSGFVLNLETLGTVAARVSGE